MEVNQTHVQFATLHRGKGVKGQKEGEGGERALKVSLRPEVHIDTPHSYDISVLRCHMTSQRSQSIQ